MKKGVGGPQSNSPKDDDDGSIGYVKLSLSDLSENFQIVVMEF